MKRLVLTATGLALPLLIGATPANAQAAARHYDCTKAGNANKTVCKNAAAAAPAAVAPAPRTARHYDCSKAGNANKAVCKGAGSAPAAPSSGSLWSRITHRTTTTTTNAAPVTRGTAATQNTSARGPNGATAKCRDGTMSFSAHHSGSCSHHGGVAQFY